MPFRLFHHVLKVVVAFLVVALLFLDCLSCFSCLFTLDDEQRVGSHTGGLVGLGHVLPHNAILSVPPCFEAFPVVALFGYLTAPVNSPDSAEFTVL